MMPKLAFEAVKKIKSHIPIVFLTYYNIILRYGIEKFVKDCKNSNVDGLIVAELPIEEANSLYNACKDNDVDLIFLIAPTTTEERLKKIIGKASGFLYLVSVLGVTGARETVGEITKKTIARVIKYTKGRIPVCIGFGISKPEHVKEVIQAGAEGAIVGSALVKLIEREEKLEEIVEFVSQLKNASRFTV